MEKKRDIIVKLTKEELGDLITTIGTAVLFLTRWGLLAQRHRSMRVRDLVLSQVRGQLIVKPRKKEKAGDGEGGSLSVSDDLGDSGFTDRIYKLHYGTIK